MIAKMLRARQSAASAAPAAPQARRLPRHVRAYAIGDVHGRLDLLDQMLGAIRQDIAARKKAQNHIVMLGDLIDRGPQSREVVERLMTFKALDIELHLLSGNHEEVLIRLLDGDASLIPDWLRFGGAETLASYGVDVQGLRDCAPRDARRRIRAAIPADHLAFLRSFADTVRIGDYLFVHAGIRPKVELADQSQVDFRWIREPFLSDETEHGFVVVHGHTITDQIIERPNRIGIDTGAYATGRLTALGLEDDSRWVVEAIEAPAAARLI